MKLDDLQAKCEAAKKETEALAAIISQASLDERSAETIKPVMRTRMVEKISKITIDLEAKARRQEEEILKFPRTNEEKEVWIQFIHTGKETGVYATLMKRETAPIVAAQEMQKHSNVWYMRPESSVKAIEELKKKVLDGDFDERLRTDPATLIFDALRRRAVSFVAEAASKASAD